MAVRSHDTVQVCSICGETFTGYGNNAWPVNDGTCCDPCNRSRVIPERIRGMARTEAVTKLAEKLAGEMIADRERGQELKDDRE